MFYFSFVSHIYMASFHKGYANLLFIIPVIVYVPDPIPRDLMSVNRAERIPFLLKEEDLMIT